MKLIYTTKELRQMSSEELSTLRRSLVDCLNTHNENKARQLNQLIGDELTRRESYRF